VPPPLDSDALPFVQAVVAAFGLAHAATEYDLACHE
jgi:hypothetical protein